MTPKESPRIATLLDMTTAGTPLTLGKEFWGFGGVHGGLSLGLLTAAMQSQCEGRDPCMVRAQFRRPLRDAFSLELDESAKGRTVTWTSARAASGGKLCVQAEGVFAGERPAARSALTPPAPSAPPPLDCDTFSVPTAFVPFAARTEVRPVGDARPFTGREKAELTAWVRLTDDDVAPDAARLAILMDVLAPSHSAVLDRPTPIPTVSLSMVLHDGLGTEDSPWVLLRARSEAARADGWVDERIEGWGPGGTFYGASTQLRLIA